MGGWAGGRVAGRVGGRGGWVGGRGWLGGWAVGGRVGGRVGGWGGGRVVAGWWWWLVVCAAIYVLPGAARSRTAGLCPDAAARAVGRQVDVRRRAPPAPEREPVAAARRRGLPLAGIPLAMRSARCLSALPSRSLARAGRGALLFLGPPVPCVEVHRSLPAARLSRAELQGARSRTKGAPAK